MADCIFCLCKAELPIIACKGYDCHKVSCGDCMKIMIDVCFNTINSMPTCICGHEFLASQLSRISTESLIKYDILCKRSLEEETLTRVTKKEAQQAMMEAVKAITRKNIREALPPAIAKLMIISGLESKLIEMEKRRKKEEEMPIVIRRCVSFTCKGILHEKDNVLRCSKCALLVCALCDAVRGLSHECKNDDVESRKLMKTIATCPSCGVPATRGEGCIFITCPFCKVNFDSNTGEKTSHGGHNNGEIKKIEHTKLTDIVPDEDIASKILLEKISKIKPTKTYSKRSDVAYESKYNRKIYSSTINRIYEFRDSGRLNPQELTNILEYLNNL